jgi:hypothetical protein
MKNNLSVMPVATDEAVLLISALERAQLKHIKNQVRSKLILCLCQEFH